MSISLDDIIHIMIEGPPLSQWDPSGAIQLWWQEKQRMTHKKYQRKKDGLSPSTSETFLDLEGWENLLADDDTDEM